MFYVDISSGNFIWRDVLKQLELSRAETPQEETVRQNLAHLKLGTNTSIPFSNRFRRAVLLILDGLFSLGLESTSCVRAFRTSLLENFGISNIAVLYLLNSYGLVGTSGPQTYSLSIGLDAVDAVCLFVKSRRSRRVAFTQVERAIANRMAKVCNMTKYLSILIINL